MQGKDLVIKIKSLPVSAADFRSWRGVSAVVSPLCSCQLYVGGLS